MRKTRFAWLGLLLALLLVCVPALAAGEELLQNGDFSTTVEGVPEAWTCSDWLEDGTAAFYTEEDPVYGTVAVVEASAPDDARFEQTVPVSPDTVYLIRGYLRADEVDGEMGANLSVADTFVSSDSMLDTCGEFVETELAVRTGPDQTEMTLYARLGGYSALAQGRAAFARLSVTEAEETDGLYIQALSGADSGTSSAETEEETKTSATPWMLLIAACFVGVWSCLAKSWRRRAPEDRAVHPAVIAAVFLAALILRLAIAAAVYGYPNDIACWEAWADAAFRDGFANFYTGGMFADYPPVYIYVLYAVGALRHLFGVVSGTPQSLMLVKLPSILADLLAGAVLYRLAKKRFSARSALLLAAVYLLNPAVLVNASAWGQVDAILALAMALCLFFAYKDRWVEAAVTLTVGVLFKPQMLFAAPMFLPGVIGYCREHKLPRILRTVGECLLAAVVSAAVIVLPFTAGRKLTWVVELLFGTAGSYPYGSVNAANLQALCGGLWVDYSQRFLGVPYQVWGWLGIVSAVGGALFAAVKDRKRENLLFYAAFLLIGIFTLGHSMHERYMFPALLLLALSYARTADPMHRRFFLGFSVPQFLNMALVLADAYLPIGSALTFILSLAQVLLYAVMTVCVFLSLFGKDPAEAMSRLWMSLRPTGRDTPATAARRFPRWIGGPQPVSAARHWDRWAIWVLTAVYAVVALVNLGDLKVPQSQWTVTDPASAFTVDLGEDAPAVTTLMEYRTLSETGAEILVEESDDRETWSPVLEQTLEYGDANDVFKWFEEDVYITSRYVRFRFPVPYVRLLELALKDVDGNRVPVMAILDVQGADADGPALLFDEQDLIPAASTCLNSTYFDEIYHARTAWEHLNGMTPYETTHPPLGKLLIMAGIAVFGMTPFGWRVVGTVFGIFMVPLLYALARELVKDGRYAFLAAFLMAWDFMHFAQTRIATIDVFAVFFILCMFFFMVRYLKLSHPEADGKQRGLMLALCGLSFGLGAATKWTCIYAGAGLAVLFFLDMALGLVRWHQARKAPQPPEWTRGYISALWLRLAWCVLFFVLIPAGLYCLSYVRYMTDGFDLNVVLENQKAMFSYHTQLVDDHFFKSPWYEWPLIIKPIWFYKDSSLPEGMMGSIASFGNPAVWWVGAVCEILLMVRLVRDRGRRWQDWFLLIGFLAQFLPWVLVPRSTFIYHYFASVPFIILASALLAEDAVTRYPKLKRAIVLWMGAVLLLFILFYPVLSGTPVSSGYGAFLKWMPTWYFTY